MNFNASRNVSGPRKAKRVSDVAAMGAAAQPPPFNPYNPAFAPAGPPPPYTEGVQLDTNPNFNNSSGPVPVGNYGFMAGYPQPGMASPSQIGSMLQQPIVQDMAMQYGNQLAAQGREAVQRELGRFLPVSRLRYYFAVDSKYVMKKLLLIIFPFMHKEWTVKFGQDSLVQPRYDINAPDLYIPFMGYVSYVLLAGFMLGIQHRFSPEQISIQSSSALAYIVFEMMLYLVTLYITQTNTNLTTLDLLAYSGYKYITMIGSLLAGLALGKNSYYCFLAYSSLALSYFLVKTLRLKVLAGSQAPEQPAYGYGAQPGTGYGIGEPSPYVDNWNKPSGAGGTKRRVYFLLFVAVTQPLLSWWLTYHLVPSAVEPLAPLAPVAPAR